MRAYLRLYYLCRRAIPRMLQIAVRRCAARLIRARNRATWPIDTRAGRRPPGFVGWPEGKQFALVLRHDVEAAAGQDRCDALLAIEQSRGLHSAFYFVPEGYPVSGELRRRIADAGCEVGVHGLRHDGRLYWSHKDFRARASRINRYLHAWDAVGFASPSSHHRPEWLHELDIEYDSSTFDTDPIEPQPDSVRTVFPMMVARGPGRDAFVELPYTLPQDLTLFVILQERDIRVWKRKLEWIAAYGGMAHVIVHPDYVRIPDSTESRYSYPIGFYSEFLDYVAEKYHDRYWNALPRQVAAYWRSVGREPATSVPVPGQEPGRPVAGVARPRLEV